MPSKNYTEHGHILRFLKSALWRFHAQNSPFGASAKPQFVPVPSIVAGLLRRQGYWTWVDYKVNLKKTTKADLGKPTMPRPEIDIIAYSPKDNTVLGVECKSYLDSTGVKTSSVMGTSHHFRVFTNQNYRRLVSAELKRQIVRDGPALPTPSIRYCLVAGKVATESDRVELHKHFEKNGWIFYDDEWTRKRLEELSKLGYEDDVAVIAAKLLVTS